MIDEEDIDEEEDIQRNLCAICQEENDNELRECQSGIPTLIEYGRLFGLEKLKTYLITRQEENSSVKIHAQCQKNIGNSIRKRKANPDYTLDIRSKISKRTTRNSIETFNWKEHCFFCGDECHVDPKHPDRRQIFNVRYLHYRENILRYCESRKDSWAEEVKLRLINCIDLVQAEARYHDDCRTKFTERGVSSKAQKGRPHNSTQQNNFEILCNWLETEGELYSLAELHEKMKKLTNSENIYSCKWLKTKLIEKYTDSIFFTEVQGKPNVVCFTDTARCLINDKWYENRKNNIEEEAERVVKLAAQIILCQIRSTEFNTDVYPSHEQMSNIELGKGWLPTYLRVFMESLVKKELKQVSIGQAIVNAVKPRSSIAPIMFGLGIETDKVFGSRWLLTELNRLGFSISHDEATRYKQSVVCSENVSDFLKTNLAGSFSQWSADNVDHNACTLDGKGTLHGMGVVVSTTPGSTIQVLTPIRRQKVRCANDVIASSGIPVVVYDPQEQPGMSSVILKPLIELNMVNVLPKELIHDHIWHTLYFHPNLRPSWSGYMTDISSGDYPGQSAVSLLPIIDLNPSDMTCIYSTLKFVESQAKDLGINTPVITFDQPLWIKASEIIKVKSLNMVCMLGGFHLLMSFIGSIGMLMKASGLEEAMEQVYGKNTVPHIISGKAISRALRAHFLAESALVCKLMIPLVDGVRQNVTHEEDEEVSDETLERASVKFN